MSEKNIVYLEVCYGKTNSICIRATKKLKKADAQYYTINDALRLGFEKLNVTRVIVLSKEEAYSAFDMEQETPVFHHASNKQTELYRVTAGNIISTGLFAMRKMNSK